jgi:arsenate reductase
MDETPYTVLFLCTGNSCRSILAEALLNELGNGRFRAVSAGSQPAGFVHPQALACLNRNRIPVVQPRSKSWDQFMSTDLHLVVTVCANAAGETCPLYPGAPTKVYWGVPDPALATGSDAEVAEVFQRVFESLREHITAFVAAVAVAEQPRLGAIATALGEPAQPSIP